jgi:hypothetical protein
MTLVDEMAADDEEGSAKGNTNQTDAHKLVRFDTWAASRGERLQLVCIRQTSSTGSQQLLRKSL